MFYRASIVAGLAGAIASNPIDVVKVFHVSICLFPKHVDF